MISITKKCDLHPTSVAKAGWREIAGADSTALRLAGGLLPAGSQRPQLAAALSRTLLKSQRWNQLQNTVVLAFQDVAQLTCKHIKSKGLLEEIHIVLGRGTI